MSFYSCQELAKLGLKSFGSNVLLSKKASIYDASKIVVGDNVRIDDFCILSGNIIIHNNVHISAYSALYGKHEIEIGNYCGCSPRTVLLSGSDDFSGEYMISPMVPEKYTNVQKGKITMMDFSQIGANSIVMPGVTIKTGAVCGAFSFIKKDLEEWKIYGGIPARVLKNRSKLLLELEKEYSNEKKGL